MSLTPRLTPEQEEELRTAIAGLTELGDVLNRLRTTGSDVTELESMRQAKLNQAKALLDNFGSGAARPKTILG